MSRPRDLTRYASRDCFGYSSPDEFEQTPSVPSGIHTITAGEATLDLLLDELDEAADSNTLVVFFPSAVTRAATWPFFQGLSVARAIQQPLLSFSDPTIAKEDNVITGWTLGDDRYWLHREIHRYIDKVRRGRRLIFVGSSAGGFPALVYGSRYPDSVSVVVNPRVHLFTPPTHIQYPPSRLYGQDSSVARLRQLLPVRATSPQNTVVYLQNAIDYAYFSGHMVPYLQELRPGARVWTHLANWGKGHKPAPAAFLQNVIGTLARRDPLESLLATLPVTRFTDIEAIRVEQFTYNVEHHTA